MLAQSNQGILSGIQIPFSAISYCDASFQAVFEVNFIYEGQQRHGWLVVSPGRVHCKRWPKIYNKILSKKVYNSLCSGKLHQILGNNIDCYLGLFLAESSKYCRSFAIQELFQEYKFMFSCFCVMKLQEKWMQRKASTGAKRDPIDTKDCKVPLRQLDGLNDNCVQNARRQDLLKIDHGEELGLKLYIIFSRPARQSPLLPATNSSSEYVSQ